MTLTAVTTKTATTADELGTLPGDFYGYAELLDPEEQQILARVRRFAEERSPRSPTPTGRRRTSPSTWSPASPRSTSSASGAPGPTAAPTQSC